MNSKLPAKRKLKPMNHPAQTQELLGKLTELSKEMFFKKGDDDLEQLQVTEDSPLDEQVAALRKQLGQQ